MILLSEVRKLIEEKAYFIENIDATVIAQRPKLASYIPQMRLNIAKVLGLEIGQVNVKATTEEGLGFTGSEEGIASQAICALTTIYESSVPVGQNAEGCEGCAGCKRQ